MGTRSRSFPWLLALLLFLLPATAAAWSGKVVGVIDGDSNAVLHDGRQEQIRLWGIDCPEKSQDFGTKAKHATSILVFAKTVEVEPVTTDRYGRTVAFVRVADTLVNEELIRQGLAWVFTRYCDKLSRGIENLPSDSLLLQLGLSEETRLNLLLEAVGIALDVDRGGMVKDPIEDLVSKPEHMLV
jgi:endonuclease YncB( thermonuclease family)